MPEPSAEPLAPDTPERIPVSSQSSTLEDPAVDDGDLMVLESSPGRPGSSKVACTNGSNLFGARSATAGSGVARLSSLYFRGPQMSTASSAVSLASNIASSNESSHVLVDSQSSSPKQPQRKSTIDLTKMNLSPGGSDGGGLAAADFGEIISQFKYTDNDDDALPPTGRSTLYGAGGPRKRMAADLSSPEEAQRHKPRWKRAAPVVVASDEEDDDAVVRGPRRSRLQRGSRPAPTPASPPSSNTPVQESNAAGRKTLVRKPPKTIDVDDYESEDSEDDALGGAFKRSFTDIEPHVMKLFNEGTLEELVEKTGASPDEAKIIEGLRPFEDTDEIESSLRKTRGVRLAIFNHYRDTMLGHAEVEAVIHECSGIFSQLKTAMKKAGVESDDATSTVKISEGVVLEQPQMISKDFKLKHYQLEGVEWLSCLRNASASGILADEMGLGKTFQVIAFLSKGVEEGRFRGPSLVVCPSSTLENWMNECAKFAPSLRVVSYYGSQAERLSLQSAYEDESSYDVMVTTYNVATTNKLDRVFLKKRRFHSLILDEGHMVKNCMSSRYKWLMQIRTPFRLLLTGTPLQNNLQELVSLLTFILPQVFSESQPMLRHAFKTKPAGKRPQGAGTDSDDMANSSVAPSGAQTPVSQSSVGPVDSQHIEQAKTLLRPFVLRRRKADVLGDLPSKTEFIVRLDLTENQRRLYDSVVPDQENASEAVRQKLMQMSPNQLDVSENGDKEPKKKADSSGSKTPVSWISSFMDMRKVADHPLLLRSKYELPQLKQMAKALLREPNYADANYQYVLEDMEVCSDFELHKICDSYPKMRKFNLPDEALLDSGKVQKLKEIVDECISRGEKLLLFSQFTSMLNILEYVFKIWDIEYSRLDGQTKVDERQTMIDEFNSEDSKVPVFLLSTKAGGFGINLTSANVVVIFDSGNNPSEERQAEDRAHRVGQVKDVRVYKLIGNNTIDEDIWECSRSKLLVEHLFWF
ncbi:hypothetical protein GQ54DRAFT_299009 [Martensiomyces pterosporus]|nr:hypothetical protein GQ54DRAFT_299009 [Martensiomyces pterosporus]